MLRKRIVDFGIRKTINSVRKNPQKAVPRLLDLMDTVARDTLAPQRKVIRDNLEDENSNVNQMLTRVYNDIDQDFLEELAVTFGVSAVFKGWDKQAKLREELGCNIPWAILLDPTSACNLHCTGCWAADYGNKLNLTFEEMDSIIEQGNELGVFFYIFTGGEPLVRKNDLIKLCEKHSDSVVLCFTNGTLVDPAFCDDVMRVKNFIPAFSVEGNRTATDARRGEGTYDKVVAAMELMHDNKLPFGISCCYTSENLDSVSSEEYIDQCIDVVFGADDQNDTDRQQDDRCHDR